jgi:hypothetical protein
MALTAAARRRALAPLEVLVGEWSEEAGVPGAPTGRSVFEWTLDGMYLLERSHIPGPQFPDSLSVVALDESGETFTKHYFDSRGVVRLYKMTLAEGVWTQLRDTSDFTPLEFHQRFVGMISDDGNTIAGAWEASPDGAAWSTDFDLTYRRVVTP